MFYPLSKTDELKCYSRYFNTVEINSTFYRPCAPKTAESWARRTPEDFEFTAKAWQQFTHNPEEWTREEAALFAEGIEPLVAAKKLGCILFQFPASFKRTTKTMERLSLLLEAFAQYPKAVELRHQSWDDVWPSLISLNAVPTYIDEPKFKDSIRQDVDQAPGTLLYVRLHGRNFEKWWKHEHRNERYDYLYTREQLRPIAVRIQSALEHKAIQRAYVFFNNHPGAKAVANAVMMRAQLGIPVEAELPDALLERFPELQARS